MAAARVKEEGGDSVDVGTVTREMEAVSEFEPIKDHDNLAPA
jgi:hypothetical protein